MEYGTFLPIRHPNLKLAACCLLATTLLPACGGGSSSSAGSGGAASPTYQRGYAQGTVDTLDIVLEDLRRLQASLAGTGAPAQTSRGTLGRSFALLEPRQRETLAASLLAFIARVAEARNAADAAGAGRDEAEAAQTAADEALQALQLVIVADTAARTSGGEAAETAAINALNQIAQVDASSPGATARINEALEAAVRVAEVEVARLERELAAAVAELGQQQASSAGVVADLRSQLSASRAALASAERALGRGDATPSRASPARVSVAYFARTNAAGDALAASELLQIPVAGVAYATGKTVLTASADATDEYPVRGTVYRGNLRNTTGAGTTVVRLYGGDRPSKYRLVRQGADDTRAFRGSDTRRMFFLPRTRTSIRFDALGQPVLSHGGEPGDGYSITDLTRVQTASCAEDTCRDPTTNDIRITFGARTDGGDPAGEPVRYWRKAVPWSRIDQDPTTPGVQDHPYWGGSDGTTTCTPGEDAGCVSDAITANRRAPHIGPPERDSVYELLLSSYAPDLNGTPGTADDTARHLSYAAYGLWNFVNTYWRNINALGAPFVYNPTARYHTFHFGLDAFGTHNPLPTRAADSFRGTFEGATMGWVVHADPSRSRTADQITGLTRLRGTVELTAHIGAVESKTNRISGAVRNLEYWDGTIWNSGAETVATLGGWSPRHSFNGLEIALAETDINAQGAFANGATSATSTTTINGITIEHEKYWGEGEYEGALYGPMTGLEAAGTWFLPADDKGTATGPGSPTHFNAIAGLVGSFGAACEETCRPDPSP